jgi:glycosyltransferase involved in cell wall biosynthesis
MKIALVNNFYYLRGGSERVMFGDRQALLAAGHQLSPFAPQDPRNEPAGSEAFFPEVTDHSTVRAAELVKVAVNLVYSNSVGRAFAAFLDDFQPDVIHCHNIYGRLTTAVLDEATIRHIPVVMTVHDQKLVCPAYLGLRQGKPCQLCSDGGYWRCVRWKCHKQSTAGSLAYSVEAYFNRFGGKYDSVSRFLCPSKFMQQSLIKAGIASARTVYHPNAVETRDYETHSEPGAYLLYAGRLSAEKGILTLLAAIEQLNVPLRIAGEGPLEQEIRDLIDSRKLPVCLEGFCAGERLAALYKSSAFTVLPSLCYENAPMAILESFAYGKSVLASNIGGIPELVADGEVGRLFTPGNVDELTGRAREMWDNREQLKTMGIRARELIERRFNQKRRISDLLSIYNNVCGCPVTETVP